MEPWTVVTTLSVLAALAAAVGGPLVKLNGTIARLSAMLEHVLPPPPGHAGGGGPQSAAEVGGNPVPAGRAGEPLRKPPVPIRAERRCL